LLVEVVKKVTAG